VLFTKTWPVQPFITYQSSPEKNRQVVNQRITNNAMKKEGDNKTQRKIEPEHTMPGMAIRLDICNKYKPFKIGHHTTYHQSRQGEARAKHTVYRHYNSRMRKGERHTTKIVLDTG